MNSSGKGVPGWAPDGTLSAAYNRLFDRFGPQKWWPAKTRFEMIVGAILTQNTNWINVEKALDCLRNEALLNPERMRRISLERLAELIRPSGYFNLKARRLKSFVEYLFMTHQGSLRRMARIPTEILRESLLTVNGIGPETADSILLYAFNRPVFVVDAYTTRFLRRHNLIGPNTGYEETRRLFERSLSRNESIFNEYHALIVRLGKEYCRPIPRCEACPLNDLAYNLKRKCGKCHRALFAREKTCGVCRP